MYAFHVETTHPLTHAGEKPAGLNAREVREMRELANKQGLFIMEAMWTRFWPAMMECQRLIQSGAIGLVQFC